MAVKNITAVFDMRDKVTGKLDALINRMSKLEKQFGDMQKGMDKVGSTSGLNKVANQMNQVSGASQSMANKVVSATNQASQAVNNGMSNQMGALAKGKNILANFGNAIKGGFEQATNFAKSGVSSLTSMIQSGMSKIGSSVAGSKLGNLGKIVGQSFKNMVGNMPDPLKGLASKVASSINSVKSTISKGMSGLFNGVKTVGSGIDKAIIAPIKSAGSSVKSGLSVLKSQISSGMSTLWSGVKVSASAVNNAVIAPFGEIGRAVSSQMSSLKSKISSGMSNLFSGVKNSKFGGFMGNMFSGIGKGISGTVSGIGRIFSSMGSTAKSALGGISSAGNSASSSMGGLGKAVLGANLAMGVLSSAFGVIKNSMGGAIDRFDTLNKYPVVMQALGYSADQVDTSMNTLIDSIDGLPTSLDEIVSSTQQIAIATGSLDKGTATAVALNNAFLASGASSADASRGMQQYVQMLSKGEVDLMSWRTLMETMPIAMDKVSKSFADQGVTSVLDLYDALNDGRITFDQFNERLIELNEGVDGFAELAGKNSKGIATSFKNIGTAVKTGLANSLTAVDEALKKAGLGSIADNLDKVKFAVKGAFKAFNEIIPKIVDFGIKAGKALSDLGIKMPDFGKLFKGFKIPKEVMNVGKDIQKMLVKSFKGIIMPKLDLNLDRLFGSGQDLSPKLRAMIPQDDIGMSSLVDRMVTSLKGLIPKVGSLIKTAGNVMTRTFSNVFHNVIPIVAEAFANLAPIVGTSIDHITRVISIIGDVINDIVIPAITRLADGFNQMVIKMMPAMEQFSRAITDGMVALQPAIQIVVGIFEQIAQAIMRLAPKVVEFASAVIPIFVEIVNHIMPIVDSIIAWLVPAIERLVEIAMEYFPIFAQIVSDAIGIVAPVIEKASDLIGKLVNEVIIPLLPVALDMFIQFWEGVKPTLEKLAEFIGNVIDMVIKFVDEVVVPNLPKVVSAFESMGAGISGLVGTITGPLDTIIGMFQSIVDWGSRVASAVSEAISGAGKLSSVGHGGGGRSFGAGGSGASFSKASGLQRVPYDGYRAVLHKNERILTPEETKAMDGGANNKPNVTVNLGGVNVYNGTDPEEIAQYIAKRIIDLS